MEFVVHVPLILKSKLVAGTEQGDINLYLLETQTAEKSLLKHSHALHCSRSQVTCLSWSSDGRYVLYPPFSSGTMTAIRENMGIELYSKQQIPKILLHNITS